MVSKQTVCLRQLAGSRAREVKFGRWLANDKVTSDVLIAHACARTGELAAGRHVLAIQDTTELNHQAHAGRVSGLGTVGNGSDVGMFLHPRLPRPQGSRIPRPEKRNRNHAHRAGRTGRAGMSTLRRFAHKDATVPANTSWCLPDLGEFRGMQECYTRQNTAMTERPACSTSDRFAETSRLNAASKNSGLTPIFSIVTRDADFEDMSIVRG